MVLYGKAIQWLDGFSERLVRTLRAILWQTKPLVIEMLYLLIHENKLKQYKIDIHYTTVIEKKETIYKNTTRREILFPVLNP